MSSSKPKASLREIFQPRFFFTCLVGCIITLWIPMAEVTATIEHEGVVTESQTTQVRMYQIYMSVPESPTSIRMWSFIAAHIGIVVIVSAFVWWLVLSAEKRAKTDAA